MISVYPDMSFNNDFTHQKFQNVLDCSSTKDYLNMYSLPVMTNTSNQYYHSSMQHPVRNNYIHQQPQQPQQQQPQQQQPQQPEQPQQLQQPSVGMPMMDNSFCYPLYNAFASPLQPPPPPPPASVNHNHFYSSPTQSFNLYKHQHQHQQQHQHQHQHLQHYSPQQQQQHCMNRTVSPLMNPSTSPCQMYDAYLPTDFYQMYHGRRSSANTSRSSSPQQDTIHSRSTSPVTKRYSCRICNKRFTRPSSLTTHTYSHTGEKPFKCSVDGCGRKFSVVSNLRRHSKIHSGNNMPTSSSSSSTAYSSYSP